MVTQATAIWLRTSLLTLSVTLFIKTGLIMLLLVGQSKAINMIYLETDDKVPYTMTMWALIIDSLRF